jgi:hypothetical protein
VTGVLRGPKGKTQPCVGLYIFGNHCCTKKQYDVPMLVHVRKTRHQGKRLSNTALSNSAPLIGDLTYSTTHYRRSGSVASLTLQARGNQTREGCLAVLYEPVLVALVADGMRFRGFESVDGTGYAQEWLVEVQSFPPLISG